MLEYDKELGKVILFIKRLLITSLAVIGIAFSACTHKNIPLAIDGVPNNDYRELYKRCNGNQCCQDSAHDLQNARGFLKTYSSNCPDGYIAKTRECVGSYRWCERDKKHH